MTSMRHLDEAVTRTLPHNVDAEQALIGACLINNDAYRKVAAIVEVDHFHEPAHRDIWRVLSAFVEKGHAATPITMKDKLGDADFGGITPTQYLANLAGTATTVVNAPDYARSVRDAALRRQLISFGQDIVSTAFDMPLEATAETLFADLEKGLEELRPGIQGDVSDFQDLSRISMAEVYDAFREERGMTGISTGFASVNEIVGGMKAEHLIILAGRPAMGKAQPLDAAIRTVDGWTTMGALRVGQELASHDGQPSAVTAIFPQGIRPVFEVTFSDGRKTKACAEHLWRVHCPRWPEPRVLSTAQVRELMGRVRYRNRLSVDLVSGDFGRIGHLPLDPWLLGLILGNGRLGGSVRLTTRNDENLKRAERLLPIGMQITRSPDGTHSLCQKEEWVRHTQNGRSPNPVAAYLLSAGLSGEGCHTMFVPDLFMSAGKADRIALLQGLMDANGYVEQSGSVRFVTTSAQLAHDVENLVRSLGGLCRVRAKHSSYSYKGERREGRLAFVCNIRHREAWMLFANSEKRKAATRTHNASVRLTFSAIQPAGEVETRCIAVSHPDRLYVTDEHIVTHNTAWATNVSVKVAQEVRSANKQGERKGWVGFFSLEMSAEQLKQRIVCDLAGVPFWKINRGKQSRAEMERFEQWEREIDRLPLAIDKTGGQSIAQIAMKARSLKRRRGLSLLVVDYLQLLKGSRRFNNRVEEVTEITTGLKALAKELGCPIIALSQLNRGLENRDDKRPKLVDLKESGSIEQDADVVIFIHREEYYIKSAEPRDPASDMHARWRADMRRWSGVAEVIVAKNRHGSTGTAELGFEPEFTRFTNEPAPREVDPQEVRERSEKKRITLPKEATILKGILRSLTIGKGVVANADQRRADHRLPAGSRLVAIEDAWKAYGTELLPAETEDKQKAGFRAAFKHLRAAELAFYTGSPEAGLFCALPEVWD